jgi:hypothetical protein
LRRLPPNGRLTVDLSDKQDVVPHLKLYCTRFASAESEGLFHFLDSFPILKDDANRLLERAVISKLDKHYQRSQEYRLLLLIYELQMISVERNGVALDYARNVLRNCKHPFKEVWYFSPYADKDMGFIIKVWPI